LLRHLVAAGVPIALATSSHLRHFTLKTTQHPELFSLFNHRVTGESWVLALMEGLAPGTGHALFWTFLPAAVAESRLLTAAQHAPSTHCCRRSSNKWQAEP
jgi:hypothetical protein